MRHPVALVIAMGLLVIACGGPAPSASPSSAGPVRAAKVDGRFQLEFGLPRDTWRADEPIDGLASLGIGLGVGVDVGGSGGGLLGFTFEEVRGTRAMAFGSTADCRDYRLEPGAPVGTKLVKSGGWSEDDPNAAFYRAFFADPLVHLPAGDWKISAVASFVEGKGCSGASHTMLATILVHVLP